MTAARKKPRVGFLGVGWIGRNRMEGILETGAVEIVAVADPSPEMAAAAKALVPDADVVAGLDELLSLDLCGVVIASPSALHADQSIRALERGAAVFCQKPLGRTRAEVEAVVAAAARADRLLEVDLSYRHTSGMKLIRDQVRAGELGKIHAIDLVFHNAYGPDKAWFYDRALSGGGCVIDLGVHLVDLALWTLDFPAARAVHSRLFNRGEPLSLPPSKVEDYAVASFDLDTGATMRLACSWGLSAGREAVISATFHGSEGGAALLNVDGSFYDFVAERYRGTHLETIFSGSEAWGTRAAAQWALRLAAGEGFDSRAEKLGEVAGLLDQTYGRA